MNLFKKIFRPHIKKILKPCYYRLVRPIIRKMPVSLKEAIAIDLGINRNNVAFQVQQENNLLSSLPPLANLSYIDKLRLAYIKEVNSNNKTIDYSTFLNDHGIEVERPASSSLILDSQIPRLAFILRHIKPSLAKTLLAGGMLQFLPYYLTATTHHQIDFLNSLEFCYTHPQINLLPNLPLQEVIYNSYYDYIIYNFPLNTIYNNFYYITETFKKTLPAATTCIFTSYMDGTFYLENIAREWRNLITFFTEKFKIIEFSMSIFNTTAVRWEFKPIELASPIHNKDEKLVLLFTGKMG